MFNMFQFNAVGNVYESKFRVHSMAFKGNTNLDNGGKILLPPSALDVLSRMQISWPVFFHVRNPGTQRSTHCGVQEFTADEGTCNMPYWMMQQLGLKEGALVVIRQQNMMPGTFAKIQPHSKDFLDISNPRAVLEKHLRDYSCMTKGDVFQFTYNDKKYAFNVLEVRPGNAVSLIETDMNVDFAPPLDYVEPEPQPVSTNAAATTASASPLEPDVHIVPTKESSISGTGVRLDGKRAKTAAQKQEAKAPQRTRLTLGTSVATVAATPAALGSAQTASASPATAAGSGSGTAPADDYWSKLGSASTLKTRKK